MHRIDADERRTMRGQRRPGALQIAIGADLAAAFRAKTIERQGHAPAARRQRQLSRRGQQHGCLTANLQHMSAGLEQTGIELATGFALPRLPVFQREVPLDRLIASKRNPDRLCSIDHQPRRDNTPVFPFR